MRRARWQCIIVDMCATIGADNKHAGWMLPAVLVLAAVLRLPGLGSVPPPLNQDEASRGYDAWAILETGSDRWGQSWPLFLESFGPGDFTAALTTYLTIPFVALLGPTALAMRLPGAILGVLTVFLLYAWLRRQVNETISLLAAAVLAMDPWHVALTRTAHESGFTPFLLTFAMLALQRSGLLPGGACGTGGTPASPPARRRCHSGRATTAWAFAAGLMLAFHTWAYPATRLFTPLFCLVLAVVYRRHLLTLFRSTAARKALAAAAGGLFIGALPLIVTVISHPEYLAARSRATLLFHRDAPAAEIAWALVKNIAANLDPRYWYIQADEMSGASIPKVGLHLAVFAPVFLVGLVRVIGTWKRYAWSRLLVAWLAIYSIPAAICGDWNPHPMRTIGGMVLYPVIVGIGGHWLIERLRSLPTRAHRPIVTLVTVLVGANLAHFADAYYREFPHLCRPGYQAGLVQAMQCVARHADDADFVLVTNYSNQPYIYALLYGPITPTEFQQTQKIAIEGRLGFHHVLRVGKYFFAPRDDLPEALDRFRAAWRSLPPSAAGIVIDIERTGVVIPGEILERIPVGDPRAEVPDQVFVVYRWQIPAEDSR